MIHHQDRKVMITAQPQFPMSLSRIAIEIDRVLGFRGYHAIGRSQLISDSPPSISIQVIPAYIRESWEYPGDIYHQLDYLRDWLKAKMNHIELISIALAPPERFANPSLCNQR